VTGVSPSVGDRASPPRPGRPLPTWDRRCARFDRTRSAAAFLLIAFASVLLAGNGLARAVAALVAADVAIMSLPWRVPRAGRSMRSILSENLAYQAVPLCAALLVLAAGPPRIRHVGDWWWYPLALLAGAALVALSGINLAMLRSGELAFLAGPRPKAHAAAHVAGALLMPFGEEAVFRGVVLFSTGASAVIAPAVAAAAFVARHYLPPQASRSARVRDIGTQAVAALALLGLTAASRSLYPAIIAHLTNNAPQAVLAAQRGRTGGDS
jgi:membrane protease YdiL (CAAX protease family)